MRLAFALGLALAACSPTELAPPPDAAADVGVDAEPCAGACGPGTVCEEGRCVAIDAGTGDASSTTDAIPADACTRSVWVDTDGDGVGTGNPQRARCDAVTPGFAMRGGDCDDGNPAAYPGAPERCDWVDTDCDGFADDDPTQIRPTGTPADMHPLNRYCRELLEAPALASVRAQVMMHSSAVRCSIPRSIAMGDEGFITSAPRCMARDGSNFTVCWTESGEVPCR